MGSVFGGGDIFVSGNGSGFGFGASVGEKPAGKSAGEAARDGAAGRSGGWDGSAAQVAGSARRCVFEIRLWLVNFRLGNRGRRGSRGLAAILGERLAGEKKGLFRHSAGCRRTWRFGRAMIEATLRGTARFEATRLSAAIFRTALIAAAILVAARFVSAGFAALRGSVFGRWKIAPANIRSLRTTATMASTTTAPAAAAAAITAAIAATVSTTIGATAIGLAATAGAWRVVLRGIVVGRKILRSGGVRIGLTLFGVVMRIVVDFGGVSVGDFAFVSGLFDAGLLVVRESLLVQRFMVRILVM